MVLGYRGNMFRNGALHIPHTHFETAQDIWKNFRCYYVLTAVS